MTEELSKPKAVYVRWRDCTSCDSWVLPPDIEEIGCPIIETIGFLTIENDEFISVSVAWEPQFGKVAGTFSIPRAQIVSIKSVTLPKMARKKRKTP